MELGMRNRSGKKRSAARIGRSYKFTNKRHPEKAIFAIALGVISLFGICAVIYLSFQEQGATKPGFGLTGLLAVLFSLTGEILSILSFRDRDSFYVLSWVGTILNLLVLIGVALLFSWGLHA